MPRTIRPIPTEDVDVDGLVDYLGRLEARGRYDGLTVYDRLAEFGVRLRQFKDRDTTVAGMVISGEVVRRLGAPDPGSYGGWGFQHQANVAAIAKLAHERGEV